MGRHTLLEGGAVAVLLEATMLGPDVEEERLRLKADITAAVAAARRGDLAECEQILTETDRRLSQIAVELRARIAEIKEGAKRTGLRELRVIA